MKRGTVNVAILKDSREKLREMAKGEHRSMKGCLELMIIKKYEKLFPSSSKKKD